MPSRYINQLNLSVKIKFYRFLGTGFTWFVTAAGAALVFIIHSPNVCLNKLIERYYFLFLAKIT
jgi:hypothetical protein